MEDRRLTLIVSAATAGAVDCSTYDGTAVWWVGFGIRLRAFAAKQETAVQALWAQRLMAGLSSGQADFDKAWEVTEKAVTAVASGLTPWHSYEDDQTRRYEKLMAIWYMNYAPEMLK